MSNPRTPDTILKELREKIAARKAIALKMLRTLPQGLSTYNPAIMAEIKDEDLFVPESASRKAFDKALFIAQQAGTHKGNAGIIESIRFQETTFIALISFEQQLDAYIKANEDQAVFERPDREMLQQLNSEMEEKISSDDPTGKFSVWAEATVNQQQDVQAFVERVRLQKDASMDIAAGLYRNWANQAETALAQHQAQLPNIAALEKQVATEQALVQQTIEEYDRDHKDSVNNYKDGVTNFNLALADAADTRENLRVRYVALVAAKSETEAELNHNIQQCEQLENELTASDRLLANLTAENRVLADRKAVLHESLKQLTGHGHIMGDSPAARLRRKAALEIERMQNELQHARSQLDYVFADEPKYQPLPYAKIARDAAEKLDSSKEVLEKEVNDTDIAQPFITRLHESVRNQVEQNNRLLLAFAEGVKHATTLDVSPLLDEYRAKRFEILHAKYKAQLEAGLTRAATDLRKARIAKLERNIALLESDIKNLNSNVARHEDIIAAKARVEKCKQTVAVRKAEIIAEIERLNLELARAKKLIDELIVLPKANPVPEERFTAERELLVAHKEKLTQQRDQVVAERQKREAEIDANMLTDKALDQIRQQYEKNAKPKIAKSEGNFWGGVAAFIFVPVAYFAGIFTAPYDAYHKAKETSGSRVAATFAGIGAFVAAAIGGGWFYGAYRIATGAPERSVENDSLHKPLLDGSESPNSSIGSASSSAASSPTGSPAITQGYLSGSEQEESAPNSPAVNVHHLHLPKPIPGRANASSPNPIAHSAPSSEWHPTVSNTVTPNSPAAAALTRETRKALHTRERDSRAVADPERNSPQRTHHPD